MTRSLQFVKDFNGVKGSRLTMMDLFTQTEIEVFKEKFLRNGNTDTIAAVGTRGEGVFGTTDEIYDDANPTSFRYSFGFF